MANDIKSGIGYIIPAAAILGYVLALIGEQFLLAIVFAVAGILVWFLYLLVMESHLPRVTGNIIILFSALLAVGVFFAFGWEVDMFGGVTVRPEGSLIALLVFLFGVMSGILFNRDRARQSELTEEEKTLVKQALEKSQTDAAATEPRVIVVKQESKPEKKEEPSPQAPYYSPAMMPYPADYYDEEEDEDEYEEEEWEDEDYEDEEEE
ncbi:MAG: hypothetical protein D6762_03745 [Candidatus Neomarinimicrobiota bacterium]|nr:MAG: hypothetical protein D6762_03745 [Candidatus Neomarinimicrobiota bacterium]